MAKRKKLQDQNPPRRVEIRGQDHLLAYITPEEAQLLMANGGTGEAGPMGIPAFAEADGDDDDVGGSVGGGIGGDDAGTAGGPGGGSSDGGGLGIGGGGGGGGGDDFDADLADSTGAQVGPSSGGMSPGRSQAQFGTTEFAGLSEQQAQGLLGAGQASQQAMDVQSSLASQKEAEIAALEQLNRDLYDLSRREQRAKAIPGIFSQVSLNNVRNIAAAMAGYPPGLLGGLNFSSKEIGSGLDPSTLASLQSRGITGATGKDPFGRETTGIVGFRDAYGDLAYGRDPNEDTTSGGDGYTQTVKPADPITGECEEGYVFDEKLNACRLDTPGFGDTTDSEDVIDSGTYARLGLLDVAPTSLFDFYSRYGVQPQDFDAANLDYRRGAGTQFGIYKDPYQKKGYTLLA